MTDSGSLLNGDDTGLVSCGARIYILEDGGTFLTNDANELSLYTIEPQDAGQHTVKIIISLQDYPEVDPI